MVEFLKKSESWGSRYLNSHYEYCSQIFVIYFIIIDMGKMRVQVEFIETKYVKLQISLLLLSEKNGNTPFLIVIVIGEVSAKYQVQ